ncbi:MAG TPA: aminotransferase class V-fold PLP-dependent enzyme, partial [Fimbriimonas sp.]|nr:aminotransferase class V-fold PLP-dependent enzyme [Fimbriimonas sp.]
MLIGAEDPSQIVFTSGATEANNWVLSPPLPPQGRGGRGERGAYISPFEHSAVREPALARGFELLKNTGYKIDLPEQANFISVMSVNNEIGARWDPREFRKLPSPFGGRGAGGEGPVKLHSDITQQVGKLPTDVTGLDYASFSAHKFYGPKGVGALYIADDPPTAFMLGGEQEQGRRAGTLNVPGIVGMGAAAAIAMDELEVNLEKAATLRSLFLDELAAKSADELMIHGGENPSPYILSLSFKGVEGETLLIEADQAGFALSAGAACSSRSSEPSHVLTALGLTDDWLRGTIRISFGRFNTEDATLALAKLLKRTVNRMRGMRL